MGGRQVTFWKLVSQSRAVFPKALVPLVIAFSWGVVTGVFLSREPPTEIEKIHATVEQRTKEIVQAALQGTSNNDAEAGRNTGTNRANY